MVPGYQHLLQKVARPFGLAGAAILVFMMLFTTYAVVMRNFFDTPVLGVVEIMELALVALIFIAMPGVFLRDEHVTVDVVDQVVSRKIRVFLRFFGLFLTLGFLIMMMSEMAEPAIDKLSDGEVTMTLGINRFIYWIPKARPRAQRWPRARPTASPASTPSRPMARPCSPVRRASIRTPRPSSPIVSAR